MPTSRQAPSTKTCAGSSNDASAHLQGAGDVGELVCVQRPADVAPAGRRHRDQAPAGAEREQAEGRGRCVTVPHLVGQPSVAQVGAAVEIVDVRLTATERVVVEHGLQQVPVGLEPVELQRAQRSATGVPRRRADQIRGP